MHLMNESAERYFVDFSSRALLSMEGPDGLDLLQRISTNDVSRLSVGEHAKTVLTNEKGRIVDVVIVFRIDESRLILSGVSKGDHHLLSWINRFIITENVRLSTISQKYFQILLLNTSIGTIASYFKDTRFLLAQVKYGDLAITNLIASLDVKTSVSTKLKSGSFEELSEQDYEGYRIRIGLPGFPNELSERFNPLEVGLQSFVSFTKGCYVGQEVIARLDTYQKVHRSLRRLHLTHPPTNLPVDLVTVEGKNSGVLTSSVSAMGEILGLGIVEKDLDLDVLKYSTSSGTMEGVARLL